MGWVLAFFGRGCYSIEADIGEENDGCAACDTGETKRHEWFPVGRFDVRTSKQQENQYSSKLHKYVYTYL